MIDLFHQSHTPIRNYFDAYLGKKTSYCCIASKNNLHFENGTYKCKGCSQTLFSSVNKYESNCGWPSFDKAIPNSIVHVEDLSHNMKSIEVKCSKCDGHLGHIFNDGPKETTGKRYCINSAALSFNKK